MFSNFIFLISFHYINLLVPNWNLTSSGIDLLSNSSVHSYLISDRELWHLFTKLRKEIIKNDEGISISNYLSYKYSYDSTNSAYSSEIQVNFSNIESNADNYIICPKGKFHPFDLTTNQSLIPINFIDEGNWELKCYRHHTNYFFVFYLMNENNNCFFSYIESSGSSSRNQLSNSSEYYQKPKYNTNISQIFDFKLKNENFYPNSPNSDNWKKEDQMLAIVSKDKYLNFISFKK